MKKLVTELTQAEVPGVGMVGIGKTLEHPMFGIGRVIEIVESDDQVRMNIDFHEVGAKWLVVEYAKLQEPTYASQKKSNSLFRRLMNKLN